MPTVRYTTVDGEVIAEKRNGVRRLYVPDPLGSTVALLDNTQTQVETATYWPYGEVRTFTGTTPVPFQFVGTLGYYSDGYLTQTVGRTYVRARYLHTVKGRWLTQDPIDPYSDDLSLYRYVFNRPSFWSDPTGLYHLIFQPTSGYCGTLQLIADPGDPQPGAQGGSGKASPNGGNVLVSCKACNNIFPTGPTRKQTHIHIPPGTYPIGPPERRGPVKGPGYNKKVGPWYIPIIGPGPGGGFVDPHGGLHPDIGVHGGRQYPGGPGYTHGTYGCIRTQDNCLNGLANLWTSQHLGKLRITINQTQ